METSVVKPRFRVRHRMAGRYYWEPVNAEAEALMTKPEGSTAVSWFWGDGRTGAGVTLNAHARAGELGMKPDQYREHVQRLAAEARELALSAHPITAGEMAEHFPELAGLVSSLPARLVDDVLAGLEPLPAFRPLPAPLPASEAARWYGEPSDWNAASSKPSRLRRFFNRKARS